MARSHQRDPKLEQFWRTKLAAWVTSGLNIRAFCRKHRLAEPSFYAWRRAIAARDGAPVATPAVAPKSNVVSRRTPKPPRPSRVTPRRTAAPVPPQFVAVRVVPDTPLELVLRSGHILRIPPGYDAGHLRTVVAALEAPPC